MSSLSREWKRGEEGGGDGRKRRGRERTGRRERLPVQHSSRPLQSGVSECVIEMGREGMEKSSTD